MNLFTALFDWIGVGGPLAIFDRLLLAGAAWGADKTVTVKPSGGTYTTLAAAIAGEITANANLVTMDGILTISIEGDWSGGPDSTAVTINGFTADSTHYLRIVADTANKAVKTGYSATRYRLETATNGITNRDDWVRIEDLQIKITASSGTVYGIRTLYGGAQTSGATVRVAGCRVTGALSGTAVGYGLWQNEDGSGYGVVQSYNNIIEGWNTTGSFGIYTQYGQTVAVFNSVVHNNATGIKQTSSSYGATTVKNSVVFNNGDDFDLLFDAPAISVISYCSSDDNDTTDTTNVAETSGWDNNFVDSTGNFTLIEGCGLENAGTNDPGSGLYSVDIDGDSYDTANGWSVGVDEYVSGGPATYNVTYDGNGSTGGTVPTDATDYEEDDPVTVLGNTGSLVKSGAVWIGWNTASDYSGTFYEATDEFAMPAANVTLYAEWVEISGTTVTAPGVSYREVVLSMAETSDDDTLVLPAGAKTWVSTLTVTKQITIQGDGAESTIITATGSMSLFVLQPGSDKAQRITAIGMVGGSETVHITGSSNGSYCLTQIRIDHCAFTGGASVVTSVGWVEGLIDNNSWLNSSRAILILGDNNQAWTRTIEAGTAHALFIEDNTFKQTNAGGGGLAENIYHQEGARTVIRYNDFDSTEYTSYDAALFDSHGNQNYYTGGSDFRGQPLIEVYNNTFRYHHSYRVCYFRGGSILFHDNAFTYVTTSTEIVVTEEEGWQSAFFSPLDDTWPAEDQINNSFFWNNTRNGSAITDVDKAAGSDATFIVEDRDYFMDAPAASGGSESYTDRQGASGRGADGTLVFTASGPNAYYPYTPYTYPHPLAGAATQYEVYYNANGGTGTVVDGSSPYEESATVTVLDPGDDGDIARTGYTFVEWNTASGGGGTAYDPDDTFAMPAATVTLYAQWLAIDYNVTYDGNGEDSGSVPTDATDYNIGDTVTTLGNTGTLVKAGYVFSGWNTQADGGGTTRGVGSTWAMGAGNVTLYARWAVPVVGGNRTASFAIATGMFGLSCLLIGFALGLAWANHRQQAAIALTRAEVLADLADPERAKARAELDYWLTHPGDKPEGDLL